MPQHPPCPLSAWLHFMGNSPSRRVGIILLHFSNTSARKLTDFFQLSFPFSSRTPTSTSGAGSHHPTSSILPLFMQEEPERLPRASLDPHFPVTLAREDRLHGSPFHRPSQLRCWPVRTGERFSLDFQSQEDAVPHTVHPLC